MITDDVSLSNVTIKADLARDSDGNPEVIERHGRRHYKVRLWIDGAPDDAHAVTWYLHESYRDPVRETIDGPEFSIQITAYGDYEVVARVRRRRFSETFRTNLSDALRSVCGDDLFASEAIGRIEAA